MSEKLRYYDGTTWRQIAPTKVEFDEHKAESATWIRVDALSAPVEITSTVLTSPTVIPLLKPYNTNTIYAVEFKIADTDGRSSQIAIFKGWASSSFGTLLAGGFGAEVYTVRKRNAPDNANAIGFYGVGGISKTLSLYVHRVFIVKEGVS